MIVLQSTLLTHGTDSPDERCAAGLTAGRETDPPAGGEGPSEERAAKHSDRDPQTAGRGQPLKKGINRIFADHN